MDPSVMDCVLLLVSDDMVTMDRCWRMLENDEVLETTGRNARFAVDRVVESSRFKSSGLQEGLIPREAMVPTDCCS